MSVVTFGTTAAKAAEGPSLREALNDIWRPVDLVLPAFADERNVELSGRLKELGAQVTELIEQLTESESRVAAMAQHQRAVEQELRRAQDLQDAKRREAESEHHMALLVERDLGRMRSKLRENEARLADLEDRRQASQTALLKQHAKLAEVQKEQQWLEDERAEWHLASEQKADDAFTLQKYQAIDAKKMQELEASLKRQRAVVQELQAKLQGEVNDTLAAQVALDKAAEAFSAQQAERDAAMAKLAQASAVLEAKDSEERALRERLTRLELERDNLQAEDRRYQAELRDAEQQKRISEADLERLEREMAEMQAAATRAEREMGTVEGEILVVQGALGATGRDISRRKEEVAGMEDTLSRRRHDLERVRNRIELLEAVQVDIRDKYHDVEKRIEATRAAVESIRSEHDSKKREAAEAQRSLQEVGKRLAEAKNTETVVQSEISGLGAGIRGLENRITTMEGQIQQQRRHIYNADFQIQALTRKLSVVRGDHSFEEAQVLKKNIAALTAQLEAEQRSAKLVKQQTGSVSAEIQRVKRAISDVAAKKLKIEDSLHELLKSASTAQDLLASTKDQHSDLLLELDSLKIQREKLLQQLEDQTAVLFGLKNRREQVHIASVERLREAESSKALLAQEARLLDQDVSQARLELKQRRILIAKLEARCDVLMKRVSSIACAASGKDSAEADPRTAQSDAIISFGRRKAALLGKSEELQSALKRANAEVLGLQQALVALRDSNAQIRQGVRPVASGAQELEELKRQKAQLSQLESEIVYLNSTIRKLAAEVSEAEAERARLDEQVNDLAAELHDKEFGED